MNALRSHAADDAVLRRLARANACPACGRRVTGFVGKWLSSPLKPVTCPACGTLSQAPSSSGGTVLVTSALLFTAAGFAASHWHAYWPMGLALGVAGGLWFLRLRMQPLLALSAEQVQRARKDAGLGLLATLLVFLFQ